MKKVLVSAVIAAGLMAGAGTAMSGEAEDKAIKARQAVMQLLAFNLGKLGAMVKGDMAYDAKQAQMAADNLKAVASIRQDAMWPMGTAMEDSGMQGKTWAKKAAWDTYPAVVKKHEAMVMAADKMAAAAGGGVDAVKGAIGAVGGSCKGCHEDFRAPRN